MGYGLWHELRADAACGGRFDAFNPRKVWKSQSIRRYLHEVPAGHRNL